MSEKYITKHTSVFFQPYSWVLGISFYNNSNMFNVQLLCFGICFWKRK